MPHCVLWGDSDWEFAIDTAIIHGQWVREGRSNQAAEVRMREKLLGTTMDARRDLRIRYIDPPADEEPLGIAAIGDYRKRLRA